MLKSKTVRQIVSFRSAADELEKELDFIQKQGNKVVNVLPTKVSPMLGTTDAAFVILYEAPEEQNE